ncbi:MAG: hypothetical protein IH989_04000 [Planctomycetes bacterium]|nr:hypothetical protein [Planctomycetota bacterium]
MPGSNRQRFIYHFEFLRPLDTWDADVKGIARAHVAYLTAAAEEWTLVLAGRSTDGEGPAVVIIETDSREEAERFMARDPFVAGRIMRASLHPFRVSLTRRNDGATASC